MEEGAAAGVTRVSVDPRRGPGAGQARSAVSQVLTPELIRAAVRRLKYIAVINVIIPCLILVIDLAFQRPMAAPASRVITVVDLVVGTLLGLSLLWLTLRLPARVLLDIAVAYEIIVGLIISIQSHAAPIEVQAGSRQWPVVAVWMITFALLIPNTRRKTVIATLATAAMDPLGLCVHLAAGAPAPSPAGWFLIFFPTPLAAVLTIIVSRILYNLTVAVTQARDLGSYHLVRLVGRGGMGEVWEAEHRLLARTAAIKLIRPDALGSKATEMLKRFEREARSTAALRSPHTVAVYDFGLTEEGSFYYVMEFLTGLNTDVLVARHGPLPPARVVHVLLQVCSSLEEAHARQLVHRDVKPANIFVCRYGLEDDFVKVLDFGLVKSIGLEGESSLTASGVVAGTPDYIAPEIAKGERGFDQRADIYSLGCVAYYLLTGKPVFTGTTPLDVLIEHVRTDPTPPSHKASQPIPPALEEIVLSCLEKSPEKRPQTARELARRLETLSLGRWTSDDASRWWRGISLAEEETAAPRGEPSLHAGERVAVIQDRPQ
jgi:serine/threonine-protein kinase